MPPDVTLSVVTEVDVLVAGERNEVVEYGVFVHEVAGRP
jgi:hypothetical protein